MFYFRAKRPHWSISGGMIGNSGRRVGRPTITIIENEDSDDDVQVDWTFEQQPDTTEQPREVVEEEGAEETKGEEKEEEEKGEEKEEEDGYYDIDLIKPLYKEIVKDNKYLKVDTDYRKEYYNSIDWSENMFIELFMNGGSGATFLNANLIISKIFIYIYITRVAGKYTGKEDEEDLDKEDMENIFIQLLRYIFKKNRLEFYTAKNINSSNLWDSIFSFCCNYYFTYLDHNLHYDFFKYTKLDNTSFKKENFGQLCFFYYFNNLNKYPYFNSDVLFSNIQQVIKGKSIFYDRGKMLSYIVNKPHHNKKNENIFAVSELNDTAYFFYFSENVYEFIMTNYFKLYNDTCYFYNFDKKNNDLFIEKTKKYLIIKDDDSKDIKKLKNNCSAIFKEIKNDILIKNSKDIISKIFKGLSDDAFSDFYYTFIHFRNLEFNLQNYLELVIVIMAMSNNLSEIDTSNYFVRFMLSMTILSLSERKKEYINEIKKKDIEQIASFYLQLEQSDLSKIEKDTEYTEDTKDTKKEEDTEDDIFEKLIKEEEKKRQIKIKKEEEQRKKLDLIKKDFLSFFSEEQKININKKVNEAKKEIQKTVSETHKFISDTLSTKQTSKQKSPVKSGGKKNPNEKTEEQRKTERYNNERTKERRQKEREELEKAIKDFEEKARSGQVVEEKTKDEYAKETEEQNKTKLIKKTIDEAKKPKMLNLAELKQKAKDKKEKSESLGFEIVIMNALNLDAVYFGKDNAKYNILNDRTKYSFVDRVFYRCTDYYINNKVMGFIYDLQNKYFYIEAKYYLNWDYNKHKFFYLAVDKIAGSFEYVPTWKLDSSTGDWYIENVKKLNKSFTYSIIPDSTNKKLFVFFATSDGSIYVIDIGKFLKSLPFNLEKVLNGDKTIDYDKFCDSLSNNNLYDYDSKLGTYGKDLIKIKDANYITKVKFPNISGIGFSFNKGLYYKPTKGQMKGGQLVDTSNVGFGDTSTEKFKASSDFNEQLQKKLNDEEIPQLRGSSKADRDRYREEMASYNKRKSEKQKEFMGQYKDDIIKANDQKFLEAGYTKDKNGRWVRPASLADVPWLNDVAGALGARKFLNKAISTGETFYNKPNLENTIALGKTAVDAFNTGKTLAEKVADPKKLIKDIAVEQGKKALGMGLNSDLSDEDYKNIHLYKNGRHLISGQNITHLKKLIKENILNPKNHHTVSIVKYGKGIKKPLKISEKTYTITPDLSLNSNKNIKNFSFSESEIKSLGFSKKDISNLLKK